MSLSMRIRLGDEVISKGTNREFKVTDEVVTGNRRILRCEPLDDAREWLWIEESKLEKI